jgi:hypothetical protein
VCVSLENVTSQPEVLLSIAIIPALWTWLNLLVKALPSILEAIPFVFHLNSFFYTQYGELIHEASIPIGGFIKRCDYLR